MKVEGTKKDNAVVVTVTGRMDAVAAPQFERACAAWLDQGERSLIVDMSGLEYCSSMGLRSILIIAKRLQASGGRFALAGLGGPVREVFRIAGLLPVFSVFETIPSASIATRAASARSRASRAVCRSASRSGERARRVSSRRPSSCGGPSRGKCRRVSAGARAPTA